MVSKQQAVFDAAADACRAIHDAEAAEIGRYLKRPPPKRLAERDALRAIADSVQGFRRVVDDACERLDRRHPARKGRPDLWDLARVEAILTGKLAEKRTGERPAFALTFEEVAELNLDERGINEA